MCCMYKHTRTKKEFLSVERERKKDELYQGIGMMVFVAMILLALDLVDWPPRVSRSELFSFFLFLFLSSINSLENRDAVPETKIVRKRVISERVTLSISESTISEIKLKLRAGFILRDGRIYVVLSSTPLFLTDNFNAYRNVN